MTEKWYIHQLWKERFEKELSKMDTLKIIKKLPRAQYFQDRVEFSIHRRSKQIPLIVAELEKRGYKVIENALPDRRKRYSA